MIGPPLALCSPCAFATACCTLRSPSVLCPPTLHYSTAHCSVEGTISIIACVVAWLPRQATYGWSAVPDRWNDWNLITASSCTPVLLADGSRHRAVPHTPARMPCQVVLILNDPCPVCRIIDLFIATTLFRNTYRWRWLDDGSVEDAHETRASNGRENLRSPHEKIGAIELLRDSDAEHHKS